MAYEHYRVNRFIPRHKTSKIKFMQGQDGQMPMISMFYGIRIAIMYEASKHRSLPHIHARYSRFKASLSIQEGVLLAGEMPSKQLKLVQAWVEIHKDELLANWELTLAGAPLFEITPLR